MTNTTREKLEKILRSDDYDLATRVDACLELAQADTKNLPNGSEAAEKIELARKLIAEYNSIVHNWF